jgi:hypothetical protein
MTIRQRKHWRLVKTKKGYRYVLVNPNEKIKRKTRKLRKPKQLSPAKRRRERAEELWREINEEHLKDIYEYKLPNSIFK